MAPTPVIVARADEAVSAGDPNVTIDPTLGVKDPHELNQIGFFILFGLIGAALVVLGVWFFFHAKNGGFEFQENDWDEYKSTVLRRRGPNGTILSNATKSTNLGGGSVYKDYDYSYRGAGEMDNDDGRTVVTESTGLSGITAGASDIAAREKRKRKQDRRDRERERRRRERGEDGGGSGNGGKEKSSRARGATAIIIDEDAEKAAQEQLRMYRSEKAARVGGMNKSSDASVWDGSTNPTISVASSSSASSGPESALLPSSSSPKAGGDDEEKNREREQRREKRRSRDASKHRSSSTRRDSRSDNKEKSSSSDKDKDKDRESRKSGGIRKVYSTADKRDSRENEKIRAEARRMQEKGRAAKRATRTITEEDERAASGYGDGPAVETHGDLGISSSSGGGGGGGGGHKRQFSWSKNETDRMLPAPGDVLDDDDDDEEEERRRRAAAGGASQVGSALSDESGTKSYHHPIPELSALRQGYRRGRGEDYDE